MKLVLRNAEAVRMFWRGIFSTMLVEGQRLVVVKRHGAKVSTPNPKAELSETGEAQVKAYADSGPRSLLHLEDMRVVLASSSPKRNIQTIDGVFGPNSIIHLPASLDLVNLGPNGEDYAAAQRLAKEFPDRYPSANAAHAHLEAEGIERLGEHPDMALVRVRAGITTMLTEVCKQGEILVVSINSPTGNQAIGVDGVLKELEAIAAVYDPATDSFTMIDRVAPEFESVPEDDTAAKSA